MKFPILQKTIRGKRLVYLDNAATMQTPACVIAAMKKYLEHQHSNVHRGIHTLADEATEAYEQARKTVAQFVNALPEEIIFVHNTTHAINKLARMLSVKKGQNVVAGVQNHHSNYLPWQQICRKEGAEFRVAEDAGSAIDENTAIVAITHVSNVTGEESQIPKTRAVLVVDAAQSVPHMPVDVKKMGCDFLAFSGHKLGAPGIGVLYGRKELLDKLEPAEYGGSMIKKIPNTWKESPANHEAGTPNVLGALALAEAIRVYQNIGMEKVLEHEKRLASKAREGLKKCGAQIIGKGTTGIVSFNMPGIHPHDMAQLLDDEGIAIRAGQHCAQPLMKQLGLGAVCRASFAIYNTEEDVQKLVEAVEKAKRVFK